MRNLKLIGFVFIVYFFILHNSWALDPVVYSVEDLKISKIAREKNYPGGRDEEDLEVQAQIIKPIRKEDIKKENINAPATNDDEF